MKHTNHHNYITFADLLLLVILAIFVATAGVFCKPSAMPGNEETFTALDRWYDESGEICSLNALPARDASVSHSLVGVDIYRKRLCFKSIDTAFEVVFNGTTTYTYAPQQARLLGRSYGMYIHTIMIPADAENVTLVLHPLYEERGAVIIDSCVEDAGRFVSKIYREGMPVFAQSALLFVFGVLMIINGFTSLHASEKQTLNFFSLGVFSILTGIWSANDTMILHIFTQRPEVVRFMVYLCMIFLPQPPVMFMASVTGWKKSIAVRVIMALTALNLTLTIMLSLFGISDVRMMLPFSHFNMAAAMIMVVGMMFLAFKNKNVDVRFLHTVLTGMGAAVVGSLVDLLRFEFFPRSMFGLTSSLFTRAGVLLFVILMGIYLMRERIRIAVEQGQAEVIRRLAYSDGLTGLANRAAFHEKEDEIRHKGINCIIVQLDINFLKKVNDVYGHAEGDRHIINAANIIRESFAEIGTSYRTGGDEFIVVAEACDIPEVETALALMEEKAAGYNKENQPPVPLQIAYGYAQYTAQDAEMLETAEHLADQRMYEKKRAMKGASS